MPTSDDLDYKRAAKQQLYQDFCKYAKAPALQRSFAAFIDLLLFGVPSIYLLRGMGSFFAVVPGVIYLLIRDGLFGGRSIGKWVAGLIVVHKETLAPCTFRQSLIRNCLYAAIFPALLLVSATALAFAMISFTVTLLVLFFTRISRVFFVGYNPDDGTTIPDSWAQTHVLTQKEVAMIFKFRKELEGATPP